MTEVWLSAGLTLPYRVASWERSYGEWESEADAREFLRLLLAGNEGMVARATPSLQDQLSYRAHAANLVCDGVIRSSPGSCRCGAFTYEGGKAAQSALVEKSNNAA